MPKYRDLIRKNPRLSHTSTMKNIFCKIPPEKHCFGTVEQGKSSMVFEPTIHHDNLKHCFAMASQDNRALQDNNIISGLN